ncbi:hypothetical protein Q5Y75_16515 [Ruegeria sp. 2205SS24-7]|uniref:hypothetical protein n=1 Tax=Ruegeria discodermiae TaxID=3064389 RepID=UPI0027408CFF|nr:hypothetical protein [Ruegeria sp. 2205SS24-7]MDP5218833.1 hypothetical protein [Ruegeria sp. 2205SS24-7]
MPFDKTLLRMNNGPIDAVYNVAMLQDGDQPKLDEDDMEWGFPSADHDGPRHWSVHRVGGSVHKEGDPGEPNEVDFNVNVGISDAQFEKLCGCEPFAIKLDLRHIDTNDEDFDGVTVTTSSGTYHFSASDAIVADISIDDVTNANPSADFDDPNPPKGMQPLWQVDFEVTVHFKGDKEVERVDGTRYEEFSLDIVKIGDFEVSGNAGWSNVFIADDDENENVSMYHDEIFDSFGTLLQTQPQPIGLSPSTATDGDSFVFRPLPPVRPDAPDDVMPDVTAFSTPLVPGASDELDQPNNVDEVLVAGLDLYETDPSGQTSFGVIGEDLF